MPVNKKKKKEKEKYANIRNGRKEWWPKRLKMSNLGGGVRTGVTYFTENESSEILKRDVMSSINSCH